MRSASLKITCRNVHFHICFKDGLHENAKKLQIEDYLEPISEFIEERESRLQDPWYGDHNQHALPHR